MKNKIELIYRGIHHSTRQTHISTARVEPAFHDSGFRVPSSAANDDPLLQKRGRSKKSQHIPATTLTFFHL
jgi:hypothetical protein